MGKAKEIAELGDKITVSGGTVTVANISTSTFSGTSIHSMQDVDLTGIAHNMFLKYNLSNTQFEVVAGNTSSIDEGTNLYYTNARADARIALANIDAKVASYLSSNDFDTATNIVASITDSAPGTLDTLNELAAALGDDANFSTTVTNSIATKLPLAGGTITGNLTVTGVGGFNDYIDLNTSGNRGKIGYDNLNLYLGSTSSTGEIHFKNNINSTGAPQSSGDTKMVITDSRVGIKNTGTDISGTSLDDVVIGAGNTVAGIVLDGGGSNDTAYGFASGGTKVGRIQYINSSNSMVFQTNNANQMTINDSGNLDVNGNISISNATSPPNVPTTYEQLYLGDLSQIYNRTSLGLSISTNNEFGGSPIHKYQANGAAGLIEMFGNSFKYYNAPTGNAGQTPSWTNRFTINASGNVGIGTTIPNSPLTISNLDNGTSFSSNRVLQLIGTSTTDGSRVSLSFSGNTSIGNGLAIIEAVNDDQSAGHTSLHMHTFNGSWNTENLVLKGGNVGIRNASPQRELHIGAADNTNHEAVIVLNNGGATGYRAGLEWRYEGNTTPRARISVNASNQILEFDTAGTERMRITSGGDVSIGSGHAGFSGWRVLNMRQLSTGALINFEDDDSARAFTFASQGSGMRYQAHIPGGYHRWETNATATALYITDGGNVGIGISDPTEKLTMTVGNGGGILQSTYYSGTVTNGQKLGVIGFKGYSQGNTVAGADAKIEGVAASNHSGSSAPAHLDFYTKPESIGPGSAAVLRHRIHEEGHQTIFKGTNNWSVQRHSQNSGCYVCHRLYGAGSSTTTYNLLRYRRHYWGSGSVKFTLSQTYYSSTSEGEYWLTGYGRSDGTYTPNYNISYVDVYNGPGSSRLSTNLPGGSPGNSDAEIVDVSISIPAYYYYMVRVEVSHSEYYTTTSVMGSHNSFALFT